MPTLCTRNGGKSPHQHHLRGLGSSRRPVPRRLENPAWGRRQMSTEFERPDSQGDDLELLATDKQRTALLRWGVARELAEDPGLARSEASKWLGALISEKKRQGKAMESVHDKPAPTTSSVSSPNSVPSSTKVANGSLPVLSSPTEPQSLELEVTVPTKVPFSSLRARAGASRKPGETLVGLGDRILDELVLVVRREVQRVEGALGNGSRGRSETGRGPLRSLTRSTQRRGRRA